MTVKKKVPKTPSKNTIPAPVLTESGRMVAYSDAIFSIALTLMALEIKIPHPEEIGGSSLLFALLERWPSFLSFLLAL